MSRCLIVFFSQGGTTNRVAESIARGLRAGNHEVDLHNLKNGPPPDAGAYDILGIGTPAYYFRPPFIVSDYLDSLPALAGKPVFVFVLHGSLCGDAGNVVRRALESKGGKEVGYSRYKGADYFLGYLKRGYLLSPNHPKPEELAQADQFGKDVAARCEGRAYAKPPYDAPPAVIYRLERFLINRLFVRQLYSRLIRLNRKKCTACGMCARLCPNRNISEDQDGFPRVGRDCLLCFSCEMKCPQGAFGSPVTWFMFWPFMVYNLAEASRDASVEHVRVVHARGRTSIAGEGTGKGK
jgi:flavodoxin/NAD-dependent dihydropyrimidine dehydrogenase PreA subunit